MTQHRLSLSPIFQPESVAVVGASATPGSVGSILISNLISNPFGGVVYPINPRRKAVHGIRCYVDPADVPDEIDLAVIATPAATVPDIIEKCVRRDVKAAIIISAGFSELGNPGRELERRIAEAAAGRMRIIGPNCLGVIRPSYNLNASFAAGMARPGKVALLSQSGAICTSILDWANSKNIGFSGFVSVGSMLDVDFADLIDYFGDDPHTSSILIYMESIGDARSFLSAARAVGRTKPIILIKAGRYEAARKAVASHTGAMAGSDAVFDAACRRAGILRVRTIRDLFHMSEILDMQPPPKGPRLTILTNAGGPGVLAVDDLVAWGGELAPLSEEDHKKLDTFLPPFWSRANPIDLLGDATPERFARALEVCVNAKDCDGVLVLLTPQAMTDPTETARRLTRFATSGGKPILAGWLGGPSVRHGREILNSAAIPTYDTPEAAVRAFMHLAQYRRNQELLYERPPAMPEDRQPDRESADRTIDQVRSSGRTLLTEVEAKRVLGAYGIPVVPTEPADSPEVAVDIAGRIGYPVVLKLLSETVTHKSDAGGIALRLNSPEEVRSAFESIRNSATAYSSSHGLAGEVFQGVSVQPMISDEGYELIVGCTTDPQFGPVILFGAGGTLVELLDDRALGLPPLNRTLARRLIEQTRIQLVFAGVRGRPRIPVDEVENFLVLVSRFIVDRPDVSELDLNPVLASPNGVIALDARIVLTDPEAAPERRLAIQPYPNQYTKTLTFRPPPGHWSGATEVPVRVRALGPQDEELIVRLVGSLSEESLRMRFFRMIKEVSREQLIRLCHLDYDRDIAIVALRDDGKPDPEPLGVARFSVRPGRDEAEFAVVVTDRWQRCGLGTGLMKALIDIARDRGIRRLMGPVLVINKPMLAFGKSLGFSERGSGDPSVVDLVMDL